MSTTPNKYTLILDPADVAAIEQIQAKYQPLGVRAHQVALSALREGLRVLIAAPSTQPGGAK
jgi:hypothetical protein